jgi:hypothetical protein
MKTKFIAVLVLLTTLMSGCKNEKSIDDLETVKPEVIDNSFKVTLGVIVKENDDFSLYYTEDGSIDFTKIDPIWMSVKGSEALQKVSYSLPEGVFPTQLRLDFGINKEQEDIILKSVILEYKGNKREFIGVNLLDFFRADENKCTFDPKTGVIKALIKDGVRQNPSLYPHEANLKPEIEKLVK